MLVIVNRAHTKILMNIHLSIIIAYSYMQIALSPKLTRKCPSLSQTDEAEVHRKMALSLGVTWHGVETHDKQYPIAYYKGTCAGVDGD